MTRARSALVVTAGALALGGCETHTVTRPPDPPIGAFGWLLVWLAVGAVGALWVAHALRLLAGPGKVSFDRRVLGGAYLTACTYLGGWGGFELFAQRRLDSILGGRECRGLSLHERPRQIVQLTCSDAFDGEALFAALVVIPGLVIGICVAMMVLRGEARPWLPTALAGASVVGLIALVADSGGTWSASDAALWTAAFAVAVTATACGSREVQRAVPAALPTASVAAGPVPATLVDRFQAIAIDALALWLPLAVLGANTSGGVEPVVLLGTVAAYSIGCTVRWGRTIGKRVLRLEVVAQGTDHPPAIRTAVVRLVALGGFPALILATGGSGLLLLVWAASILAPAASGDRRPGHDRVAGTRVVRLPG